jgi:precorrin-6A/cobalt-precorrin-6A reductase
VVDATHPFAAQMSANAEQACSSTSVPRVRLQRPAWIEQDGDRWHRVPDLDAAAGALADLGARRVLLTTGRQELQPFAGLTSTWFLVRAVDAPDPQPLPDAEVLLDRGPFTFDAELGLLRDYGIDALLTKDSGGAATAPKMEAARTLAIPVIVVDRPSPPPGPLVTDAAAAATWAADTLRHLQAD